MRTFTIHGGAEVGRCRGCEELVYWLKRSKVTKSGERWPKLGKALLKVDPSGRPHKCSFLRRLDFRQRKTARS